MLISLLHSSKKKRSKQNTASFPQFSHLPSNKFCCWLLILGLMGSAKGGEKKKNQTLSRDHKEKMMSH